MILSERLSWVRADRFPISGGIGPARRLLGRDNPVTRFPVRVTPCHISTEVPRFQGMIQLGPSVLLYKTNRERESRVLTWASDDLWTEKNTRIKPIRNGLKQNLYNMVSCMENTPFTLYPVQRENITT